MTGDTGAVLLLLLLLLLGSRERRKLHASLQAHTVRSPWLASSFLGLALCGVMTEHRGGPELLP